MRAFIALEVSEAFSWELEGLARVLSAQVEGHFAPPENYHLTLAFLGEIGEHEAELAIDAIDAACEDAQSIPLVATGIGAFGSGRSKTLHLALRKDPELMRLAERLRSELSARGISFDKSYSFVPHITLARKAIVKPAELNNLPFPSEDDAAAVALFKSTLTRDGSVYKELYRYEL